MNLLWFIVARLKEPSSYAGLGAVLAAAGIHIDNSILNAAIQVIVSIAGLIAVLVPERVKMSP
ncbi:MAG TPA: hypothetical protein VGR45_02825 [Stellaceae bacterium]|nr:hypothetical protein [Stellaceae bacterium]